MAIQGQIFLDLIQLGLYDGRHGILLSVNDLLLKGCIGLRPGNGGRRRTKGLHHIDVDRGFHDPYFHPFHICRGFDGKFRVREVSEPRLSVSKHSHSRLLQNIRFHRISKRTIHNRPGHGTIGEEVGNVKDHCLFVKP